MASVEDLIKSLHGGAHVNQDLHALQEYLSQNLQNQTLYHANNNTFRPAPSRSTSTTRPPPLHLAHSHSHSHDSYHQQPFATPLVQTPFPGEDPSQSTSTLVRPQALRRSSSYGFGFGSQPSSPYTEYTAFEGDAFAPLVQPECPADPWARWKQPGNTDNAPSAWSNNQSQANGFGMKQNSQFGQMFGARFQSPVRNRVERVSTPPDEDDEMMDTEMDMGNEMEEDEDAVEREMDLADSGTMSHIPRPDSAPGAIEMGSMGWRGEGFDTWGRGRRKM